VSGGIGRVVSVETGDRVKTGVLTEEMFLVCSFSTIAGLDPDNREVAVRRKIRQHPAIIPTRLILTRKERSLMVIHSYCRGNPRIARKRIAIIIISIIAIMTLSQGIAFPGFPFDTGRDPA
jgi:hypothetical protein